MKVRILMSALSLAVVAQIYAETPLKENDITAEQDVLMQQYEASIDKLVTKLKSPNINEDTQMNPRLIRLFGKPTLYNSSVKNALEGEENVELYAIDDADYLALSNESEITHHDNIEAAIDNAILEASLTQTDKFIYTENRINENIVAVSNKVEQEVVANILPYVASAQPQDNLVVGTEIKTKKPNFWKTSGETWLQFQQNYISGNWSQGGESTNTLSSGLTLNANYNDQKKIQWDNKFEAKLGFTTAPSDTEHKYRTNSDMLRITSKLLLKAIKSWNYSFQVESKTQSLRSYQNNSTKYTSAFLAPLETKVGIGMDYKKSLKNFNISVNIAPLSYRYVYVMEKFLASRYGIKNGHRSLQEYGSNTTINSSWQITKNIRWTSHIDAFTSYEKMIANWENTFDFAVSKYLSTKIFMHGRFDDGVRKKDGYTYFQFKEYLQFGLSYKW